MNIPLEAALAKILVSCGLPSVSTGHRLWGREESQSLHSNDYVGLIGVILRAT